MNDVNITDNRFQNMNKDFKFRMILDKISWKLGKMFKFRLMFVKIS